MEPPEIPASSHTRWNDLRRVESWAGELRVNFVRAVALAAFYGHHLVRHGVLKDAAAGGEYHKAITMIVTAWAAFALALHQALGRRFFPPWLKYAVQAVDLLFVTLVVMAAGGPRSALAILYVIVVASAALRLSLKLVWMSTAGAMTAYLALVVWVIRVGTPEQRIAHREQVVFMLALLAVGALGGQMVRQARRLVEGSPVEVEEAA